MNKGFTLFTALVAALLVVLSVLLVEAMNNTQKSASQVVVEARIDQEMIDTATLAQSDSLQEFNFALRRTIQEYFTNTADNFYTIPAGLWQQTGTLDSGIKLDFVNDHFGLNSGSSSESRFAQYMADKIIQILSENSEKNTPDYVIKISMTDTQKLEFKRILTKSFTSAGAVNPGFLEIIDCSETNCPKGSFYLNLDFSPQTLSDQDYELLPSVEVIKKSTCKKVTAAANGIETEACSKVVKIPVIPRTKLRIFVPLRIFKGIVEAKNIARQMYFDTNPSAVVNRLENAKLGVCDSRKIDLCCASGVPPLVNYSRVSDELWYTCMPRNNPDQPEFGAAGIPDKICVDYSSQTSGRELDFVRLPGPLGSYDPTDTAGTQGALRQHVVSILTDDAARNSSTRLGELSTDASFTVEAPYFSNPDIDVISRNSRNISFAGVLGPLNSTCTKIDEFGFSLVFKELDPLYTMTSDPATDPFRFRVQIEKLADLDFPQGENETIASCTSVQTESMASCTGYVAPTGCAIIERTATCP